jgi:hypothetical protein
MSEARKYGPPIYRPDRAARPRGGLGQCRNAYRLSRRRRGRGTPCARVSSDGTERADRPASVQGVAAPRRLFRPPPDRLCDTHGIAVRTIREGRCAEPPQLR